MNHRNSSLRVIVLLIFATGLFIPNTMGIISDGRGVFRVAVFVGDMTTHDPIQGAKLTMKNTGAGELVAQDTLKHLLPMFSPKTTGEFGDAFVYYYGGFYEETGQDGTMKHSHQVRGVLVIEKEGFETMEVDLAKFIGPSFDDARSIPLVQRYLKPKAKN